MDKPKIVSQSQCWGGWVRFYSHESFSCQTEMRFSVYFPPQAEKGRVPVLYWLSGLTCTEENFMVKSGAQRLAAQHGILLVAPDTSPRKVSIPGDSESWEFGKGAGFYVNATEPKWSSHYHMYDYVNRELPSLIENHFPVMPDRRAIFGHSMGGHGALISALREPGRYLSVSAFAPISAPSLCPWGQKAFRGYLGENRKTWEEYDANCLVKKAKERLPFLIDQGTEDPYLKEQLLIGVLKETCEATNYPLTLRMRPGYDHGYYFISTFIGEHIEYHARHLL